MKLKLNQNQWIKMGRLYRRVPMVKHIHPLLIPMVIFIGLNFYLIRANKKQICTCDQWTRDDKLRSLGNAGNKIVQNYLNHLDDYMNCEAKRALLLKELERKKQLEE